MTALAQVSDIEALAGRSLTTAEAANASTLLDMASGVVQDEIRQTLTAVSGDVYTLLLPSSREGEVILPERPVTNVSSVVVGGTVLPSNQYVVHKNTGVLTFWGGPSGVPYPTAVVTYDHGFTIIPATITMIVASLAWSQINNPQGLRQFALGDYSGTFAGAAVSGDMALSQDQKDALKRYSRNRRSIRLDLR